MAGSRDTRELRAQGQSLKATVQVGKDGLTPEVAEELRRQMKAKSLVKVRLNASFPAEAADAAAKLAEASASDIVDVRGRTVVLRRR